MAWALKSADSKLTTFLADKILAEYSTSSTFSSRDLLDSFGTSIVVSDRLPFPEGEAYETYCFLSARCHFIEVSLNCQCL